MWPDQLDQLTSCWNKICTIYNEMWGLPEFKIWLWFIQSDRDTVVRNNKTLSNNIKSTNKFIFSVFSVSFSVIQCHFLNVPISALFGMSRDAYQEPVFFGTSSELGQSRSTVNILDKRYCCRYFLFICPYSRHRIDNYTATVGRWWCRTSSFL